MTAAWLASKAACGASQGCRRVDSERVETPLALFLARMLLTAACSSHVVQTTFSAVHASLVAARGRAGAASDASATYLDDPLKLFIPLRLLRGGSSWPLVILIARVGTGLVPRPGVPRRGFASSAVGQLLPAVLVRQSPSGARSPAAGFHAFAASSRRSRAHHRLDRTPPPTARQSDDGVSDRRAPSARREARHIAGRRPPPPVGRRLHRNRRPRSHDAAPRHRRDSSDATIEDLRQLFREQQYSRLPVFTENLDTILGIVFVKDLVAALPPADAPVTS